MTVAGRPHVVVLNRWQDRYAEYENYLDHDRYAVTYIATEVGSAGVPPAAAEVVRVAATDDVEPVARAVDRLARRHGAPTAVIALKEDDLSTAALIGQRWGCPGRSPAEITRFRDKLVMTRTVAAAGLPVPASAPALDAAAVRSHADRHGWPVVVKPRVGSSSEGVTVVSSGREAAGLRYGDRRMLVQSRLDDPVHHVDGVFDGVRLGPWRLSRYVDTCLGFRAGRPLGSIEQDDPGLLQAVRGFATSVMGALTDRPATFHLEIFVGRSDDGSWHCTFLEVGARVGGAEIPFVWREVHGYDLMRAATRIALGLAPQAPLPPHRSPALSGNQPPEIAGWLLVPAPARRPCRITRVESLTGLIPPMYAEIVPRVGDVLPASDTYYEHVGARYRFRGPDSAAVEAAVRDVARAARVIAEACDGRDALHPVPVATGAAL